MEQALGRVQVVLHNQDNREHDLLDSDDYYQFHGGLSAAVEAGVRSSVHSCGLATIPAPSDPGCTGSKRNWTR